MALPKIDLPMYELVLPSTGEKIKYRPFTVKEEKILLVAQESKDSSQEILAVKQVVNNCLIDKDVSELAMFDLEYVILVLRSRSVDNTIEFNIKDPETQETVTLAVDLEGVTVTKTPGHSNEVRINEDFILYLKYPTIDEYIKILSVDNKDPLLNYLMMVSCLDKLASEDEVHKFKDYKSEEVDAFVETFSGDVIRKIEQFFQTMPKLKHEFKYTNKNGKEQTFVVEGIRSFFT